MNQTQQFLKFLQQRKDEEIAKWCVCVRISVSGDLVITKLPDKLVGLASHETYRTGAVIPPAQSAANRGFGQ